MLLVLDLTLFGYDIVVEEVTLTNLSITTITYHKEDNYHGDLEIHWWRYKVTVSKAT